MIRGIIYQVQPTSPPRLNSGVFWCFAKSVLSDAASRVRIMLFAAYGFDLQYVIPSILVQFADPEMVMGIQHLLFSPTEVREYVAKWFSGVACLQTTASDGSSAMETFCANLELLTGRHVFYSRVNICSALVPSAHDWIRKLQDGSLYEANGELLFEVLT
uniref:Uncharacterized protein n=1 Tax=Globisporangium ultimum (strain ATCC 200006 / CBS 805.95 / DAOM BR144) TaxID=431595 RepID=K3X9Y6_GLOUD